MRLTIGSEVKPYIPYVSNTLYAVNSDGTVDNVSSIYPTTTILALTDNDVTINATYNKDINAVIDNIETKLENSATTTTETFSNTLISDGWVKVTEENPKYTYTYSFVVPLGEFTSNMDDEIFNKTIIFDVSPSATLAQRKAAENACLYGFIKSYTDDDEYYNYYFEIGMTADNIPEADIPIEVVVM